MAEARQKAPQAIATSPNPAVRDGRVKPTGYQPAHWRPGGRRQEGDRAPDPAATIAALGPDGRLLGRARVDHVEPGVYALRDALDAVAEAGGKQLLLAGRPSEYLAMPEDVTEGERLERWPAAQEVLAAGWRFRTYLREMREGGAGIAAWTDVERDGVKVVVVVPELDPEIFPVELDVRELLEMVAALSRALGRRWHEYPSATFLDLLRDTRGKEGIGAPELPPATTQTLFATWEREPTADEWARQHAHLMDRSGSYLSGLAGVAVGHGQLERLDQDAARRAWAETPARPGSWRVRQTGPDPAIARGLPPLLPGVELGSEAQVPTPTLRLLADFNAPHEILGAELWTEWKWPNPKTGRTGDYFRPAAELLTKARVQLRERTDLAGRAAYAAFKLIYGKGLQRLDMADGKPGDRWHRPDVLEAVQATARANLMRSLGKAVIAPVSYNAKDSCLFLVSAEPPEGAAAEVGIPYGNGVGQWHDKGAWPTEDVRARRAAPTTAREQLAMRKAERWADRSGRRQLARQLAERYLQREQGGRAGRTFDAAVRGLKKDEEGGQ